MVWCLGLEMLAGFSPSVLRSLVGTNTRQLLLRGEHLGRGELLLRDQVWDELIGQDKLLRDGFLEGSCSFSGSRDLARVSVFYGVSFLAGVSSYSTSSIEISRSVVVSHSASCRSIENEGASVTSTFSRSSSFPGVMFLSGATLLSDATVF